MWIFPENNVLSAFQQQRLRDRPCGCGEATLDGIGNVTRVESCSACLKDALDFLRYGCYSANDLRPVVGERQLDLFEGPVSQQALPLYLGTEQKYGT